MNAVREPIGMSAIGGVEIDERELFHRGHLPDELALADDHALANVPVAPSRGRE